MTPNPNYGGPHAKIVSPFDALPFTSDSAEWNAVKAGKVDIGYMPQTDVPQKDSIASTYNTYGVPGFGFSYIVYNFKNTTGDFNNIIKQLYFRQAIAHLQDEKGIINAFFHGAGTEAYGPVPSEPKSPYSPANATTAPYPFSVDAAASLLKNHGWKVNPGGTSVCQNAGSGANQCGPVPAGTKLAFNLIYGTSPATIGQQVTDLASRARRRHQHQAADQQLQLHDRQYLNPARGQEEHQQVGDDGLRRFSIATYPTMNGIFNTPARQHRELRRPKADQLIRTRPPAATATRCRRQDT
jgi:peptide/nickel transport system substrate-binding protein